jgi:hypothetical protein
MTAKHNILSDLDALIKRASAEKATTLKTAESVSASLDNMDDGTKPGTTGEQAASMAAEQEKTYADNMVDTNAKDNPVGGSVDNNTDGASAGSTDGEDGPSKTDFAVAKDADNGSEKPENKVAHIRQFANELRKAAASLLSPLDHFLVKAARSMPGPQAKVAMEMDDEDAAESSADALMEQLAAGEIGEDEAAAILEEAVEAGALSEEDLAAAAELAMESEAEDMGGMDDMDDMDDMEKMGSAQQLDAELQQKLAAAEIGPDHPEYMEKLVAIYGDDVRNGYSYAMKLAEALMAEEAGAEEPTPEELAAAEAEAAAAAGGEGAPADEDEAAALAAVQEELGLDDAALAELMAAEVPPMDKVAAAKARYRAAILSKVAALRG